jgi:hypothetical protein
MPIRLFTSGTHKGLSFSNEDIEAIYHFSNTGTGRVPFVIGHPKNDLPIVGWLERKSIMIYDEAGKKSIGFERKDAELSDESIDVLKKLKKDKISVRLTNGAITHIGLVGNAAVEENNNQSFSADVKTGVLCFSEDFQFDEPKDTEPSWVKAMLLRMDNFFSNNKTSDMTDKEKELQKEIDALKNKVSDFEKKEKKEEENAELASLKAKISDFEKRDKEALKSELKTKVEALKLSAEDAKTKMDFGTNLIDKDIDLAKSWIADLKPATVSKAVRQGAVTDDDSHEFAADGKKDVHKSAEADIKKQFDNLKTQA